ncbi:hypothetical protein L916_02856 [Phytophthora nicotianae]|uniref:Uncharacterized protein n=1 Tax=Phytophthora nicotianae TaxID=4792 RepID=W2JP37_PHYNI|nr:hypothetical protein L916_02856 [Phytophthora nicotianae]
MNKRDGAKEVMASCGGDHAKARKGGGSCQKITREARSQTAEVCRKEYQSDQDLR